MKVVSKIMLVSLVMTLGHAAAFACGEGSEAKGFQAAPAKVERTPEQSLPNNNQGTTVHQATEQQVQSNP